jgi:DNA-binding transcriptional LysR family regulator
LTPDGQEFFAVVTEALHAIASAAARIGPQAGRGSLRLWCMPGLASQWLMPRLSDLERHLSGTEIVLRAIDRAPDFARFEADAMIAFGQADDMPSDAIALIRPRIFPVVSPDWLARNGMPGRLDALMDIPLIHEESHEQWRRWLVAAGLTSPARLTGPRLWNANLCLEAALAGQGIALALQPMASEYLRQGRLVEVFATDIRLGGYYLIAPPARWADPVMSGFRAWIEANLK